MSSVGSSSSNRMECAGFILPKDLDVDEEDNLHELNDRLDKSRFALMTREAAASDGNPLSPIGDEVEVRVPHLDRERFIKS